MDKIGTNWWKLAEIGWNWLKLRGGEILWPFFLQGNLRAKFIDETYSRLKKNERNWVKLNEIGWNWVKLRVAIFAIFLTFVISCNFRQFWPIFVAVSGDLIGHFLYTSNFKCCKKSASSREFWRYCAYIFTNWYKSPEKTKHSGVQ